MDFIIKHNLEVMNEDKESKNFSFYVSSESKLLFLSMIRFYQTFISSQHIGKKICVFTPSCSHFGLYSIKKYGVFYGILMTSDRIQRCHGLSGKFYSIDSSTGKFYDPVEYYYFNFGRMSF
jgi:putative membrane protein insertion efficiency factor